MLFRRRDSEDAGLVQAVRRGEGGRLLWEFDTDAVGWQVRAIDYTQQLRPPLPVEVRDGVLHVPLPDVSEGRMQPVMLARCLAAKFSVQAFGSGTIAGGRGRD